MGNCPSDLTCEDGEKKVCFRDDDNVRQGFCLNSANDRHVKKIINGETMCAPPPPPPPPPPPCPTSGYYFLGEDLGDVDETVKQFLNTVSAGGRHEYCNRVNRGDSTTDAESMLALGRVSFTLADDIAIDTYISEARDYIDTITDDHKKAPRKDFVDFFENNATSFSTDGGALDIQKFADFMEKTIKIACPSSTTESYTGKFSKNNLFVFVALMILLIIIHECLHK